MNGLGKAYFHLMSESLKAHDARKADDWRELHRRPDALPLPEEPESPVRVGRLAAMMPILRRIRVGRA